MLFYPLVVRNFKVRTWYLLIFSLYFYYKTGGLYVILLLVTSAINFVIGAGIHKAGSKAQKRWLMLLSLIWNLGSLGYFKYTNFIIETINQLGGNLPFMTSSCPWASPSLPFKP